MLLTLSHGGQDANAPAAPARRVAAEPPDTRPAVCEDDAHLSTPRNRFDDLACALVGG